MYSFNCQYTFTDTSRQSVIVSKFRKDLFEIV